MPFAMRLVSEKTKNYFSKIGILLFQIVLGGAAVQIRRLHLIDRSINMSLSEQRQRNNELAKEVIECRDILYSVPEAAKLLHVNKNMVYDLIRCGYLRSIKLGSRKVSRKALLDFVEQFEGQTVELPGVRSE